MSGDEVSGQSLRVRSYQLAKPQPILARFLRRPSRGGNEGRDNALKPETETTDITELVDYPSSRTGTLSHTVVATPSHSLYDENEEDQLLPRSRAGPPTSADADKFSTADESHLPVPAIVLFARNAAPLYLPQIDDYLAKFPRPPFAPQDGKGSQMFPPMDKLTKSGMSLDDLETNDKILPGWKDRKNVLGAILSALLGILGSSLLSTFYSVKGLLNTIQIFALLLSTIVPVKGNNLKNNWHKLFLGTIPNVLALNFGTTLLQSILPLILFTAIAFGLLYIFYRYSRNCEHYNSIEGHQSMGTRSSQWGLVIVTFLLTVIYLPLSTMAVHVLVWSQDLWVVPNPYTNATSFPPIVPTLGPSNVYRDPLDFCWTTTMDRNQVNYAPFLVIIAIVTVATLAIWFPIELQRVVKMSVPKVDRYTELGRRRNNVELDGEYQRLLLRDHSPFAFLYNGEPLLTPPTNI